MRRPKTLGLLVAVLLGASVLAACGSGDTVSGGKVKVVFWHGQNDAAKKTIDGLIADFNRTHPNIEVDGNLGGVLADQMTTKVTAALAAGSYPDVAYIFGSDLANIARSPKVLDLTDTVHANGFGWDDFWPAEQQAASVDGRVRGMPALVDDLGIVYNKKLFDAAGIGYPNDSWSWDDFRTAARKLTDAGSGTFGTGWPGAGAEDTVWRLWPMLWQQGGDILNPDHSATAFDSPQGRTALSLVHDMAAVDKSVFVDSDPSSQRMNQLFNDGKMGMLVAGPWALPDIVDAKIDYGVTGLPGFGGNHTTISGADDWVLFDNGSARSKATIEFITWLTDPAQDIRWTQGVDNLPIRRASLKEPGYQDFVKRVAGIQVFVDNLPGARARPAVAAYPKVSAAVGQALVGSLLGQTDPATALHKAAQDGDTALKGP
ncbi:ABC transporter substrate-binding protein [Solihabitans fulvus]|uniref:ABC transporter substrate-binding protein n=1 Tax=Solihabitans fulvus TaxID=1892852 RepID=A0A5B2XVX0_9PSEU|nr:ABC transporter substrate-binding protein [Solihabitans fulvus]KAA2267009.1 ABC transporter substrate-binding protein [Solihabitans fulvus]